MKVGDYVRTECGRIYKIGDIGNFIYSEDDVIIQGIIKSSPNIIDLIQVGDYVNGGKVYEIKTTADYVVINADYGRLFEFMNIYEKDIKSIVTKEQFENMEYKVKE